MPEMSSYEPGVPSWVDMGARDLNSVTRFYTQLFGWETADQGEEAGHYTIVSKQGKQVAALSPMQEGGGPPHWATYFNVADADETARRVEQAGGKVLMDPMDVMDAGRMAVFADPTGAVFSIWQPGSHIGAELVNEPGSLVWNELSTSDLERAKAFYSAVFGWGWGGSDDYAEFQVSGRTVGAVMPRPEQMPSEVPDSWLVYFASDDLDGDLQKAVELGATTFVGPTEIPGAGRFAVLADPEGAAFALFSG